tara:strand:- start:78 stop:572 length:495 start_codon:yes stop_codon:yes gene_type:complete
MKIKFFIISTFSLFLYSHEIEINKIQSELGMSVKSFSYIQINKSDFLPSNTDHFINQSYESSTKMDSNNPLESLKSRFYQALPDGHYATVYVNSNGKEVYWESIGDPFLKSAYHRHDGEEIIYFSDKANIAIKIYKDIDFSEVKIALKNKNRINFSSTSIRNSK